jgi:hypothetical protein
VVDDECGHHEEHDDAGDHHGGVAQFDVEGAGDLEGILFAAASHLLLFHAEVPVDLIEHLLPIAQQPDQLVALGLAGHLSHYPVLRAFRQKVEDWLEWEVNVLAPSRSVHLDLE